MALKIMGCALVMALPLLPVSAQTSACEAGEELEIVTSSEAMRAALDADLRPVLADKTVALARTERAIAAPDGAFYGGPPIPTRPMTERQDGVRAACRHCDPEL